MKAYEQMNEQMNERMNEHVISYTELAWFDSDSLSRASVPLCQFSLADVSLCGQGVHFRFVLIQREGHRWREEKKCGKRTDEE